MPPECVYLDSWLCFVGVVDLFFLAGAFSAKFHGGLAKEIFYPFSLIALVVWTIIGFLPFIRCSGV